MLAIDGKWGSDDEAMIPRKFGLRKPLASLDMPRTLYISLVRPST